MKRNTIRRYGYYFIALIIGLFFFSSCQPSKQYLYFKTLEKDTVLTRYVSPGLETKIRKGDNLGISINSLSVEENIKFNPTVLSTSSTGGIGVSSYMVSSDGTIKIHRLGEIKVEGLTRRELALQLEQGLLPYLKSPIVNVSYLNRKITIAGNVAKPQVLNIPDEQISIIDALVMSGDIREDGRKDNILIIRSNDSTNIVKRVNLEDHSIFNSEWYYLQADDIVYVSQESFKKDREERRRRIQTTLSLVATATSLLILILTRVF